MEMYFILLEKMRNLVETVVVRELNWKKLVDKIITYCFIEWNINMIRVEIYFGSLIIFLEVNKCYAINLDVA